MKNVDMKSKILEMISDMMMDETGKKARPKVVEIDIEHAPKDLPPISELPDHDMMSNDGDCDMDDNCDMDHEQDEDEDEDRKPRKGFWD